MGQPLFSKQIDIKIDSSILASATDFSLSVSKDMIEIATLGSTGAKNNVPDMYGYTISGSGLVFRGEPNTDKPFNDMMANLISANDASVNWTILPDTSTTKYYSGYGYLTSLSYEGGVGAAMTYSFEIAGDGAIVISTTA